MTKIHNGEVYFSEDTLLVPVAEFEINRICEPMSESDLDAL